MLGRTHRLMVRLGAAALFALAAVLVLSPAASAQTQTVVKGQGSSAAIGFVKVRARGDAANAKGSFRGRPATIFSASSLDISASGRDVKGRVTCVDRFQDPSRAGVGGVLKRPIVADGLTFTHFLFQVWDLGPGRDFAFTFMFQDFEWESPFFGGCGQILWFGIAWQAILEGDEAVLRFARVTGDFVVSTRPARFDDEREDDGDDGDDGGGEDD